MLDQLWQGQLEAYLTDGPGRPDMLRILAEEDDRVYHSVTFYLAQLNEDPLSFMTAAVISDPEATFAKCDQILVNANQKVFNSIRDAEMKSRMKVKSKLKFRLTDLNIKEFQRHTIPRSADVGLFLSMTGTVVKTILPKMLPYAKDFVCTKCRYIFLVEADYEQCFILDKPKKCPNPVECDGFKFNAVSKEINVDLCKDYQEIKVQEQVGKLNLGTIPRSIWVTLEDDLVDSCKPGDDITVEGIVKRRWQPLGKGPDGRTEIDLALKAIHIKVNNDQQSKYLLTEEQILEFKKFWEQYETNPLEGRNKILASFCPQIFGLYSIKMALAVVLCGGVERVDKSGTRVRGDSHLFLLGDPGTGKSQLLRYASKLSQRSVLTTGIGSTNAGLTVSAVRDGGEWQLEAGALVLADGGVCCIDEFNSIREADRTCIHEAMEQQSLSVAKAGLVCKLQTKCSVLAAANPRGQYDPSKPLTVNSAIASPLLSRFDIIFVLLDSKNLEWDRIVSENLLLGRRHLVSTPETSSLWSNEKLQAYFSYCKQLNPDMSSEASAILSKFYQSQRKSQDESNMSRTTVRLLQSAIRLAQGHAKLMCHEVVEVMDAVYAVVLLSRSVESSQQIDYNSNPLHSSFPPDAMEEYRLNAQSTLTKLGLGMIWDEEEERLNKLVHGSPTLSRVGSNYKPDRKFKRFEDSGDVILTQVMSKLEQRNLNYEDVTDNIVKKPSRPEKRQVDDGIGTCFGKKRENVTDFDTPSSSKRLKQDQSFNIHEIESDFNTTLISSTQAKKKEEIAIKKAVQEPKASVKESKSEVLISNKTVSESENFLSKSQDFDISRKMVQKKLDDSSQKSIKTCVRSMFENSDEEILDFDI